MNQSKFTNLHSIPYTNLPELFAALQKIQELSPVSGDQLDTYGDTSIERNNKAILQRVDMADGTTHYNLML